MIEIRVGKDLLGHFIPTPARENFAFNKQDEVSTPSLGRLASTIQSVHAANTFSLPFHLQSTALFFLILLSQIKCLLSLRFSFSNFNPLLSLFPYSSPNTVTYFHLFFPYELEVICSHFLILCTTLHLFDRKIMKAPNFPIWHISWTGMYATELSRERRHLNVFRY